MAVLEYQQPDLVPRRLTSRKLLIAGVSGVIAAVVAFLSWSSVLIFFVLMGTPLLALPGLMVKYLDFSPSKGLTQLCISACAFVQFALYGLLVASRFKGKRLVVGLIVLLHLGWFAFMVVQLGNL